MQLISERCLARNVQAPGWAFLLLAVAIFFNFVSSERRDLKLVKEYESVEQLCQPVTDAYQNWHSDIDPDPSRVAVALALYESQNIDDACLEKEAHFSLWRNQDKDLGYLALGLSLSNEDKKFSEYIDKVCKTDKGGEVCQFAMAVEAERSGVAVDLRLPASLEHGSGLSQMPEVHRDFIRLHIERQLHEHNQLSAALEVIEKSAATPNFADYLNLERLKIMWEMDRMLEARAAFQASRAHETGASRLQLSSWMCSAEVLSGCKNESKSACADFVADYDQLDNEPQSELVELNYIRAQKCVSAESLDYVNVGKKLFSDHAHDYLTALELVEDRKYGGARKLFKHIADQAESEEFQFQATADLVKLASTKIELDYFFEEFLSKDNLRAEPNFAFELFNKYLTLGDFDKVAAVGESLIKAFPYKTSLYTTLLKEAKKHKRVKFAQKIRLQFKKMMPLSTALESEKL